MTKTFNKVIHRIAKSVEQQSCSFRDRLTAKYFFPFFPNLPTALNAWNYLSWAKGNWKKKYCINIILKNEENLIRRKEEATPQRWDCCDGKKRRNIQKKIYNKRISYYSIQWFSVKSPLEYLSLREIKEDVRLWGSENVADIHVCVCVRMCLSVCVPSVASWTISRISPEKRCKILYPILCYLPFSRGLLNFVINKCRNESSRVKSSRKTRKRLSKNLQLFYFQYCDTFHPFQADRTKSCRTMVSVKRSKQSPYFILFFVMLMLCIPAMYPIETFLPVGRSVQPSVGASPQTTGYSVAIHFLASVHVRLCHDQIERIYFFVILVALCNDKC